ncbi:S1/P1 nuclease [Pseudoxanthomonas daejeonensis]|uniref:S1/P1 nuclease n=1 Tax=Pseudoxanthomonas daejeonensis TaxID=266062 RepID=UPI001F5425E4|nr:S1/P1 nuclease [Pseudoxanthomonas daejeonensis]UNK58078.1 S1/P1 nuclease [Pseudoxanthomonas daejeonensis]
MLFLPVALAIALPVHAWGALGHRLVARLAEDGLTPQARAGVARLLQGETEPTLAGIATWADELRGNDPALGKRSARWHYVNIGGDDCAYQAARDCPGGDCVVAALETQARILADPARTDAERRQALKFVVHFVGDAHQPLHAGHAGDRGGNDYQVNWRGKGSNLHSLWDSGMLNAQGLEEDAWLARLRALPAPAPVSPLPARAPQAWAEQSCRLVIAPGFYPPGHVIDDAYVAAHLPAAETQLRLAGARLAATLNTAFGATY